MHKPAFARAPSAPAGLHDAALAGCYKLSRVALRRAPRAPGDQLRALSALAGLRDLNLKGCYKVADAGLAGVGALTALTALNLHECWQVTAQGLQALSGARPPLLSGCVGVCVGVCGMWGCVHVWVCVGVGVCFGSVSGWTLWRVAKDLGLNTAAQCITHVSAAMRGQGPGSERSASGGARARRAEPAARPEPAGLPQHRDRAGAGPAGPGRPDRADRAEPARLRQPGGRRAAAARRADRAAGARPQRLPEADRRRVRAWKTCNPTPRIPRCGRSTSAAARS